MRTPNDNPMRDLTFAIFVNGRFNGYEWKGHTDREGNVTVDTLRDEIAFSLDSCGVADGKFTVEVVNKKDNAYVLTDMLNEIFTKDEQKAIKEAVRYYLDRWPNEDTHDAMQTAQTKLKEIL